MNRFVLLFSLCILPLWWIFLVLWQPGFVHTLAHTDSPAIERALEYATVGGRQNEDIYFTSDEIAHLTDVSRLYRPVSITLNVLAFVAWGILVLALVQKQDLQSLFRTSSKILMGILSLLFICLLFFSVFFEKFHEILFPQGNWQFPADSMLITLFPEMFWQLMLGTILFFLLIFSIVYWLLGKKQ